MRREHHHTAPGGYRIAQVLRAGDRYVVPVGVELAVEKVERIDSRQLRGKVILVDLWGSWCEPCLKKMPELKELYSKWHDKGLEIIGISFDEDPEEAQAVIERLKLPWPSANLPPPKVRFASCGAAATRSRFCRPF